MKKIVLTGPESSGKTSLAEALAGRLGAPMTPEYARTYLEQLNRPYEEEDLFHIARGQLALEEACAAKAEEWLIVDTSLVVLKIWSEYKYGRCHPFILEKLQKNSYDLFLLCRPDIPWTPDPLREHPDKREELFGIYQRALIALGVPYEVICGQGEERMERALAAIARLEF
jgi:NadR type nicotinamide-nucleotide adenylyltransferase